MTNARDAEAPHGSLRPAAWQRRYRALAQKPGVSTVTRKLSGGRALPLAYVRSGPRSAAPTLVIPGGPGLASVMPYQQLRGAAAKQELDVLMVEHRGVGMSRKTADGVDLSSDDISVQEVLSDLVAVLDSEGIEQVTVYGTSYGSYLAGAFGTAYPHRVRGMILDSPVLDGQSRRETARELNRLYWHGAGPTSAHAARVRALAARVSLTPDNAGFPLQLLHESGGPDLVARMLDLLEQGRGARVWGWLGRLGAADVMRARPFLMEFDLVARSAFSELGYGLPHDERLGPLRSDGSIAGLSRLSERFPSFAGDPVDVRGAFACFGWPMLVLSGDRDVRTPRTVAEQVIASAPNAKLTPIERHGHSALDTAEAHALNAMQQLANALGTAPPAVLPAAVPAVPAELPARPPAIARLIVLRLAPAGALPKAVS